jgi:hypothetical protein
MLLSVRSLIDESETSAVDDTRDILPSLNRGLMYAYNILARKYPEPILTYMSQTLTSGTAEYDMPEDAFEDRVEKIELTDGSFYYPCRRTSYRDITPFEAIGNSSIPPLWTTYGRKIRFVPAPTGGYTARIWYIQEPNELVTSQGRITTVSTSGGGYVLVEGLGSDLTTTDDDLENYVNIVDGQTGMVKSSHQINNITGTKITFRANPTRTTVLGRTIATSVPTTVAADDYVCVVRGTCIPYQMYPIGNFCVEYAALEMRGVRLSEDVQVLDKLVDKFETQVQRSWVKREVDHRISRKGSRTGRGRVRYY